MEHGAGQGGGWDRKYAKWRMGHGFLSFPL